VAWSTKDVKEAVTNVLNDKSISYLPKELKSQLEGLKEVNHPIDYIIALSVGPPLTYASQIRLPSEGHR